LGIAHSTPMIFIRAFVAAATMGVLAWLSDGTGDDGNRRGARIAPPDGPGDPIPQITGLPPVIATVEPET
jgi:hypothetical protein